MSLEVVSVYTDGKDKQLEHYLAKAENGNNWTTHLNCYPDEPFSVFEISNLQCK